MPFLLLVLGLLGGSLVCLLVINTTLGDASFRLNQLQSANTTLSEQQQTLQQAIAAAQSPNQIAQRAYDLGMRSQSQLSYLDLATGRTYRVGVRGPGMVEPSVASSTAQGNAAGTAKPQPAGKQVTAGVLAGVARWAQPGTGTSGTTGTSPGAAGQGGGAAPGSTGAGSGT